MSDKEVVDCAWMTLKESTKAKNIHIQCGIAIDMIIKSSLVRRTLDNVTAVMIAFQNFESNFNSQNESLISDKNYKTNVQEVKYTDNTKIEYLYHSNKENNVYKTKAKLNEELDKYEINAKSSFNSHITKSGNTTASLINSSNKKLTSVDSDPYSSNDKNFYSKKLNINLSEIKYNPQQKVGSFNGLDNKSNLKDYPVSTKNYKSNSFKGDFVKK